MLSAAIDRAISEMDFEELEGKDVYFDPQYLKGVSDEGYIVSTIRQKLLASGVFLKAIRDEATYAAEARASPLGTHRQDVLLGVPQTALPAGALAAGVPSVIPEIPLAKKTHQKGVAKIAIFAYNQTTGQALWQSGTTPITADARDTWVLGTGPFQRGSIYNGSSFIGTRVRWPWSEPARAASDPGSIAPVNVAQTFTEDPDVIVPAPPNVAKKENKTMPASFVPAVPPSLPQPGRVPSAVPPSSTSPSTTSGFNSTMYNISGSADTSGSSGGNAAAAGAAGVFLYKNAAAAKDAAK